ncbi:MAG TPA: tetratricopeptide repeat protein [Terriglobales bacterium]|jgi:tetratricopeptide (TPR) repeat protein|nr:tetratricopeptide repeat protein [Terriglobales bacterium]
MLAFIKFRIRLFRIASTVIFALMLCVSAIAADGPSSLLAQGRVDEAIAALQRKITVSPNDAEAQNLLCRAYFTLGEWDRGIAACQRAIALDPGNSRYHLWLGRTYGEKADKSGFLTAAGLANKVRSEFELAVQLNPRNIDARTDLAEFYLEAPGIVGGGRDKAEAQARSLAGIDPAKAHWVNGRLDEKKKDFNSAEREYRKAIDASHGSANSWLNLAIFYRHIGRLDEMESAIQNAATAQMDSTGAVMDAAELLIRTKRNVPESARLLRQYLSSQSTVEQAPAFKAHYLLGTVLEEQGNKQAAADEYRAALSLAKDFQPAHQALDRVNRLN